MDKLIEFLDRIIPLFPFYPSWARTLFLASFLAAMLSITVFVILYRAASKRNGDASEQSAIGLNVSLLDAVKRSDVPLEADDSFAVNYAASRNNETHVCRLLHLAPSRQWVIERQTGR
jgi:hypothetical protein